MPRRNRKARCLPDADLLAVAIGTLILVPAAASAKYPCAGCGRRGFWDGEYCPACKGRIIRDARHHATRRG
jgi:DNA-directed RNA polymerase subunit RPC12/RpoP